MVFPTSLGYVEVSALRWIVLFVKIMKATWLVQEKTRNNTNKCSAPRVIA